MFSRKTSITCVVPTVLAATLVVGAVRGLAADDNDDVPLAKSPISGRPFDDREIVRFLESSARKLHAAKKLTPIRSLPRKCSLRLPLPNPKPLSSVEIAAQAEAATVVLGEFYRDPEKSDLQFASAAGGFLITSSGAMITSLHVVSGKESKGFVALTRDGRVHAVRKALAADQIQDVAVLQLDLAEGASVPALPLATKAAPSGTRVFVMSHPDEHFWMLTAGYVSRNTLWRTPRGDENYTTITADYAKGSSGCPVLDECGNVVAIVNNTESVYYDDDGGKRQMDLQMVIKNTTPAWVARNLFEPPAK